jgi:DNA-directed RNA polymerase specialized sigma24 family protein
MRLNKKLIQKNYIAEDDLFVKELIKSHFSALHRYVLKNGGNKEDAEDLMQDALIVFLNVIHNDKYKIEKNDSLYFKGIYIKLWANHCRKLTNEMHIEDENIKFYIDIMEIENVMTEINRNERYKLYYKHLQKIDINCQKIFRLMQNGVSVIDIIEEFNFTKLYFYKKKSLCKKELLKRIKNDPDYKNLGF